MLLILLECTALRYVSIMIIVLCARKQANISHRTLTRAPSQTSPTQTTLSSILSSTFSRTAGSCPRAVTAGSHHPLAFGKSRPTQSSRSHGPTGRTPQASMPTERSKTSAPFLSQSRTLPSLPPVWSHPLEASTLPTCTPVTSLPLLALLLPLPTSPTSTT